MDASPSYRYEFTSKSAKQLQKLPKDIQKRIIAKLDEYCQVNPSDHAERLIDFRLGEFRFRIGEWRVIFDLEDTTLVILKVGHRRDIYR